MKRLLVLGWLLGLLTFAAVSTVGNQWYEYHWARSDIDARDMVNEGDGWHVVPDQANGRYLRRSRFHLP